MTPSGRQDSGLRCVEGGKWNPPKLRQSDDYVQKIKQNVTHQNIDLQWT